MQPQIAYLGRRNYRPSNVKELTERGQYLPPQGDLALQADSTGQGLERGQGAEDAHQCDQSDHEVRAVRCDGCPERFRREVVLVAGEAE
jgi:hypothetical protein